MKFSGLRTLAFTHPTHNDLAWLLISEINEKYRRNAFNEGNNCTPEHMEIIYKQLVYDCPALKATGNIEQVINLDTAIDKVKLKEIFQFIIRCCDA